jgi:hypothetical protein
MGGSLGTLGQRAATLDLRRHARLNMLAKVRDLIFSLLHRDASSAEVIERRTVRSNVAVYSRNRSDRRKPEIEPAKAAFPVFLSGSRYMRYPRTGLDKWT